MRGLAARLQRFVQRQGAGLIALIAVQILCTLVFLQDLLREAQSLGRGFGATTLPECLATLGLCLGIGVELYLWRGMQQRQADMARGLSVAAGAIDGLMRRYFHDWDLTPAESDVAAFTIKGCSIAEVAQLRGSAEGTVKAHLNAIYRKAGVAGRAQLVSLLVEDLFNAPLPAARPAQSEDAKATKAAHSKVLPRPPEV
jgi:DNA-binding CsgD family transcriptional regulator